MKKPLTTSVMGRLYLLALLCFISITQSSCLFNYYSPSTTLSFTGTTSYCQGASASANTLNYGQCTLGGGIISTGVSYTAQWYYNTTGGTSIPASTPLGAPVSGTSPSGGSGSLSYVPLTSTAGTYYYFCYISWLTTGTCSSSFTSSAQTVTITPPPSPILGSGLVCLGGTRTLTTAVPGGTWSSSNPTVATVSGGVVSGLAAGTATIAYGSGGCVSTLVVTVNTPPSSITPATAVSVCEGASTTLSCTSSGGTWTSSTPSVATVSPSGIVNGIMGGTTTITYTVTSTGCYTTKPVTVNPLPLPITGVTEVCPLGATTLYDAAPGGVWSSADPGTASVDPVTGIVSGIATGTTTITYSGCGTATTTVSVHPSPAPITGPSYVCHAGGTITLSSLTLGGTWMSDYPTIAAVATSGPGSGDVTGGTLGTANITYTSTLGCLTFHDVTVVPDPDPITGSVPICVGQSMALSETIPGGTWSSAVAGIATVSSTGIVTGMSAGTTLITYHGNCSYVTTAVTINPIPDPITGNDTVCEGTTLVLADATIGGTWSSSVPAVAPVMLTSGIVTGLAVGTTVISYIMPGGCYNVLPVYVVPMPADNVGPGEVCEGATIHLSNPASGGRWSSGNVSIATVDMSSGVVTGVTADTVVITYTTGAGCLANSVVTVHPLPAPIYGDLGIYCGNFIDTLFDITPGGTWSSLSPLVATVEAATGIVTTHAGGTATIKYTLSTGCYVTRTFSVHPLPGPVVNYDTPNNTFYTQTGFTSYQWYDSLQGMIPGATTYKTAALYYGYYYVVVTDTNGCAAESPHHPYNVDIAGVEGVNGKPGYSIFPNPASQTLNISAPTGTTVRISSVVGKVLISAVDAREVDISQLANAVYVVSLYNSDGELVFATNLVKR